MNFQNNAKLIRQFLTEAEALKRELRHSYLSDGRTESVAEHVWQVSLLSLIVQPYISCKIDQLKLLKMIVVHDLVEIYAGDIPITETISSSEARKIKKKKEMEAIDIIYNKLPTPVNEDVRNLWLEYEDNTSKEANIAHALDKLEAQAQHNDAGIDTWVPEEYHFAYKLKKHTADEAVLEEIADILVGEVDKMLSTKTKYNLTT